MSKVELNVVERLAILNALPQENNYLTLKVIRDLKAQLGVTEDEFKEYELKFVDDQITWNAKGNEKKPFEIGSKAEDIIKTALVSLDKQGKLTEHHVSIYELFVKKPEE